MGGVDDKNVKDKVEEEYETEVKLPCGRTVGGVQHQKSLEELSTVHAAAIKASRKNKRGGEVKAAEGLTTNTTTASGRVVSQIHNQYKCCLAGRNRKQSSQKVARCNV